MPRGGNERGRAEESGRERHGDRREPAIDSRERFCEIHG